MKSKNKPVKFAIVSLVVIGGCGLIYKLRVILAFGLLFIGLLLSPNPPAPEITYGEFPIMVTYQVDDEIKTLNDVVVCEFDGFVNLGTGGKRREWKEQLKSGKEMLTLLDLRDENYFTDWGTQVLEICLDPGSAEYYLSEEEPSFGPPGPPDDEYIDYIYLTHDGQQGYSAFKPEEILEKFNLKILDIEYSQPIVNSFK